MQVTSKNIGLLPDGRYTIETNLQVRVTKSKASFIFRYQFAGRRRDLSLGSHPTVTVTAAKQEAAKCRALLARGIDPLDVRAEHRAEHARRALDFASYAEHALETIFELKHLSEATKVSWRGPMKNHILPVLRHKLVADITVQDICEVLDPLWEKKTTIASRIRGQLEAIFTLAKREGVYIGENPATWKGNLEAYFPPPARVHRREHQKAYTIEALADQLKASLRVDRPVHNAFVFGVLTATRQAEFNDAKWSEIDFEHKVWTVPPERRKDRKPEPFRVPLSDQAIALLKRITPESEYIFSGSYYNNRSVARYYVSTMVQYASGGTATMHGCRSTFRDWCAREGIDTAVAEKCLMHSLKSVQAAYQRDDLLVRRRPVMQQWADAILPMSLLSDHK